MKNLMWTDTQQYLAQAEYGVSAWSADVEMSIEGLPGHGKLPRLANGYGRESKYQRAVQRIRNHSEGHAFAKTFSEATNWGNRQMEAPAFYHRELLMPGNVTEKAATGLIILPYVRNPELEVTLKGVSFEHSDIPGWLGGYNITIGLEYGGKDREFKPQQLRKLSSLQEKIRACFQGHPDAEKDKSSGQKFPLLYKMYGAEISVLHGIDDYGELDRKNNVQLRVRDQRLEEIAREMHEAVLRRIKACD